VFRRAHLEGIIPRNPVALVEHLPEQRRERVVSEDEFQRLRAECDGELRRWIDVLWHTGCRAGEVDRIQPDGWIAKTKNGEARRVPLNATAKAALESGFESASRALGQRFRNAARRAGLEDVRPHDLRHSCAVRLRRKGVDLVVIKELLGHKSWQMVSRYQHVGSDELMAAVAED
jgi:integrase